ncbi:MAG TPA: helix-turn-helix domain-containing protein, partial [Ktedonobacteraceae bacterium]|nr:helix-turn-helix domain-containing protein [Ktedonobacteraceae bacterium]
MKKTPVQEALVELRHQLNLTQQQLTYELKVGAMTVSRWETNRSPSGQSLVLLADYALVRGKPRIAAVF